jgi:hypothetical protein
MTKLQRSLIIVLFGLVLSLTINLPLPSQTSTLALRQKAQERGQIEAAN